jgi:hypothetical protein
MHISRETNNELIMMQEDLAEHFTDEFFPISGETYWTCVESLATAKLAELRGQVKPDEKPSNVVIINTNNL